MSAENPDTNKELVRAFVAAVNARDYQALDALVAEDVVRHSAAAPNLQVIDRVGLKAFLAADATAFPDGNTSLEKIVAEGELVAVQAKFAGTMTGPMGDIPPTGKRVEAPFMSIFRIEEGVITEFWVEMDNVNILTQLGLLQLPAVSP